MIIFPDGKTLLVDAGMEAYGKVLVETLRRLNIKRLDYVLFSHQHNDHTFGAIREGGVFDHFEIGQVYWNGIYNGNWKNISLEQICEEKNIPAQTKHGICGFNDARAIHKTRGGIRPVAVSLPARYIHSPYSSIRLSDAEKTVELIKILSRDLAEV